ncbi:MAG: tRNA 4-thiouridine(8) synthase ThiI [Candidatus Bathyarchaeota archaeon]|nr:MAG: tRNA 4-thiouridine(8) synthase ThiI [Candidatus Bathyarchaeota archaeon]
MDWAPDSVIVRLGGEIWIKKSWTRRWYLRRLVRNIRVVLEHYDVAYDQIIRRNGRVFVATCEAQASAKRLSRIFGVSSVSPALNTGTDLDAIVNVSLSVAQRILTAGNSFAVRCKRVGKHPYTSQEVCRVVGRRILEALADRKVRVDLDNPDLRIGVEVRDDLAFVFAEVIKGVGGFPLGVQGRIVGLLSGGLDSAVACWLVMKRGCSVVPLYFDNDPYTGESVNKRTVEVARVLSDWAVGFPRSLYIVSYGASLKEIVEGTPRRLTCILCKRLMYRIAERISDRVGAEGLVTGEAIGEQASQTLRNLRVLDEAAERYPVHRPLLGFDKAETEMLARKIGTYEVSARSVEGCEAVPYKPATKAKLEEVMEAESKLDIKKMVDRCVGGLAVVSL